MKLLSLDSSFIPNKYATEKLGRNIYYRNKRGRKISAIVDEKGIPLNIHLSAGNKHDARIAPKIISKIKVSGDYLLADKAYDSNKIREMIKSKKIKSIIPRRKYKNRRTKSLKKKHVQIYKKRIIVENFFAWIKAYPKINCIYEKTSESFKGLLLLSISILIYKRL